MYFYWWATFSNFPLHFGLSDVSDVVVEDGSTEDIYFEPGVTRVLDAGSSRWLTYYFRPRGDLALHMLETPLDVTDRRADLKVLAEIDPPPEWCEALATLNALPTSAELEENRLEAVARAREVAARVPPPAAAYFEDMLAILRAEGRRFIRSLRWRFNLGLAARDITDEGLWWFTADEKAHRPAVVNQIELPKPWAAEAILTDEDLQFAESHDGGFVGEPLARELLFEAVDLQFSNPRAALVLAVTAAEVGVKSFVAGHGEAVGWFVTEAEAPPVTRLIRDLLPLLTERRTKDGRVVPLALRQQLQTAIEQRNAIVHRGDVSPGAIELNDSIRAVNDFLFLLDWLSGHEWAFDHMADGTRACWD